MPAQFPRRTGLLAIAGLLGTPLVLPPRATAVPAPPTGLTAVADQAARTITLDWDDVPNASYRIYEAGSPEGRTGFDGGTTSRSVRGPMGADREYDYWVTAIVDGVESGQSVHAKATIGAAGVLLWSSTFDTFDDFQNGDSGIRQVDPPRTTAAIVADPAGGSNRVGRFTVNSGSRAEFMPAFRALREGDDLWFAGSARAIHWTPSGR